jgi:hypothetical protein
MRPGTKVEIHPANFWLSLYCSFIANLIRGYFMSEHKSELDPDLAPEFDYGSFCRALEFHLAEPSTEAFQLRIKAVNEASTHPGILEHIAFQGPVFLVKRVAEHPAAPAHVMAKLADHTHYEVRAALACNHALTIDLQWQLAQDEHPDVRFALAEAYDADPIVLAVLSEDENPYVADRARTTLQRMQSGAAYACMPFRAPEKPQVVKRRRLG